MRTRTLIAVTALLLPVVATAQTQQTVPDQDWLLSRIIEFGQRFHDKLPSLICDERTLSQELHHDTVRKQADMQGTLRVRRDPAASIGFTDERRFDTVDGLPALNRTWKLPYMVSGAFAVTFTPLQRELLPCYTVRSTAEADGTSRVELTAKPGLGKDIPCRNVPHGYHKVFTLDHDGNVTDTVRTMDTGYAHHMHDSPYSEVHFAPVALGPERVWMPVRIVRSDTYGRMIATYSNFHRYAGSGTIVQDSVAETH